MVRVKPFAAIRPAKQFAAEVAAPPYDVVDSLEAKALAGDKSLLHITRPEIDFDPMLPPGDERGYVRAVENFAAWQSRGWLVRDEKPCYYLCAQTMDGRTQYGIVLCAHAADYENGVIKKHELTRKDKEDDRVMLVRTQNANMEPVFFAYRDEEELDAIVAQVTSAGPEYSLEDENGTLHRFWVIDDESRISRITELFETRVQAFYIADGHHRTAAAVRVMEERRALNPVHTGEEEYNFFMAVCFPESQLHIMDYNRVVRDLAGLTDAQFLLALSEDFEVQETGTSVYAPRGLHNFSMYLSGKWYSLTAKPGRYDDDDPTESLDVSVLSRCVLDRILGIKDLRRDGRIDFVGGRKGLEELSRRVDSGEMKVAFALYPVSFKQLTDIADSGSIMPPKTTWFEPKLRSGLAIHKLD